jgi:hypothetical protein
MWRYPDQLAGRWWKELLPGERNDADRCSKAGLIKLIPIYVEQRVETDYDVNGSLRMAGAMFAKRRQEDTQVWCLERNDRLSSLQRTGERF